MAFIAHPSVRIKGTEHTYNPALCQDEQCGSNGKGRHMHCPFCSVFEAYQDPVILRAHYRVKHVDKGLDFAGLKIIRCCNHCEIVGTIKGEKKFKGAHWHCYRCRNGFNRRDEAIKHYKTHFRNPHTTFQIQITQDINSRQYYEPSPEAHPKAYGGLTIAMGTNIDLLFFGSTMAHTSLTAASPGFQTDRGIESFTFHTFKDSSSSSGVQVGAEETISVTSPSSSSSSSTLTAHQSLVLTEPEGDGGNIMFEEAPNTVTVQAIGSSEQALLEKHLMALQQENHRLVEEKEETEQKLHAEILQLKEHIRNVVRANVQMSEELKRYQCSEDLESRVKKMVQKMEWQHRELLQVQVAALKKEFAQNEGYLVNGKSHHAQELPGSASPHTLWHRNAISSENGSSNNIHPTMHGGLLATQGFVAPRQIDLGAGEVISFMDPVRSSSTDDLETMEFVEVHLHKEQTLSHMDTAASPTHMHLFPLETMHKGPLLATTQPSSGEKRLAEHVLAREDKPKLQRTV